MSWWGYLPFQSAPATALHGYVSEHFKGTWAETASSAAVTASKSLDLGRGLAEGVVSRGRRAWDVMDHWEPWRLAANQPWWQYGEAWSDFATVGFDYAVPVTFIVGSTHNMLLDYRDARDGGVGPGWEAFGVGVMKNAFMLRHLWTLTDAYEGRTYDGRALSSSEQAAAWTGGSIGLAMDSFTLATLMLGGAGGGASNTVRSPSGTPKPVKPAYATAGGGTGRAAPRGVLPRLTLQVPEVQAVTEAPWTAGQKVRSGWKWANTKHLGGVPPGWIAASAAVSAGGGGTSNIDKRLEPIAQKYAQERNAGRRPMYADLFGPKHAKKPVAQQRAEQKSLRNYIRAHAARLGVTVPKSGGTRGGNAATSATLASIDNHFASRGLATHTEYPIQHKPGRRSHRSQRFADRVVFDGSTVHVIQSVETLPSGAIALREIWAGGDIIASKTVAHWRQQGFTVEVHFIKRGDLYLPENILGEADMMQHLHSKWLYPKGMSVRGLKRW